MKNKRLQSIIRDTSGETIVEVLVAFILLTMMMLVFAQGLAFATTSEVNAKNSRDGADKSMETLQEKLISPDPTAGAAAGSEIDAGDGEVKPYTYVIDGNKYVVFFPVS